MDWLYLFIAGLLEVAWPIGFKYSKGFTKILPTIPTMLALLLSFALLSKASNNPRKSVRPQGEALRLTASGISSATHSTRLRSLMGSRPRSSNRPACGWRSTSRKNIKSKRPASCRAFAFLRPQGESNPRRRRERAMS